MITKVKLSTSQLPLDATNNLLAPASVIIPVGSGLSLNGTTPLANTVEFDDTVDGNIAQNTTVFAKLKKAVGAVSAYLQMQVPLCIQGTTCGIYAGNGSPEGVVAAPPGSLYLNTAGGAATSLYVKQTGVGNTGWIGK
jgi:hypothetical protein